MVSRGFSSARPFIIEFDSRKEKTIFRCENFYLDFNFIIGNGFVIYVSGKVLICYFSEMFEKSGIYHLIRKNFERNLKMFTKDQRRRGKNWT